MDTLSPVSEEEREDGEIVDDDLEDISDYSIPSCGKSDNSESIISSISLSSISITDSEDEYFCKRGVYISIGKTPEDKKHMEYYKRKRKLVRCKKKVIRKRRKSSLDESFPKKKNESNFVLAKKQIEKYLFDGSVLRSRKTSGSSNRSYKHCPLVTSSTSRRRKRRKSLSRSPSYDSSSDSDVLDRRTLRQLNKAIRIDSGDVQPKTLKDRLKTMIEPDSIEVNTLPLNPIVPDVIEVTDEESSANENAKTSKIDESLDKELEELRLQALKSAVLEKHSKRKRRKEMLSNQKSNFELPNVSNKENETLNIPMPPTPPIQNNEKFEHVLSPFEEKVVTLEAEPKIIQKSQINFEPQETKVVRLTEESQSPTYEDKPEKPKNPDPEDDLEVMRAMLLASMNKKLSMVQTSRPNSLNVSPTPPTELSNDKSKKFSSLPDLKIPSVKPLIIRVNHASESDTSEFEDEEEIPEASTASQIQPKIENSVEEFLRKQREEFEANLQQNESFEPDPALDKSNLKLLPKSQQQEYKLLKQKLLQASKSASEPKSTKPIPSKITKTTAAIVKEAKTTTRDSTKKDRLQQKGKYKELAPLIRKINVEIEAKRKCQEHVKKLMEDLQAARVQLATHQQRHTTLVNHLKRARGLIDQRLAAKSAQAKLQQQKQQQQQQQKQAVQTVARPSIKPALVTRNVTKSVKNGVPNIEISTSAIIKPKDIPPCNGLPPKTTVESSATTTINQSSSISVSNTCLENKPATAVVEPFAYVSPLDNRGSTCNSTSNNPLEMLCPYELFGVCKDKSCTFNHCP